MELKSTVPDIILIKSKDMPSIVSQFAVNKNTRPAKFKPFGYSDGSTVLSDESLPLMVRCKRVLGDRMEERWQGYYLDGRHVSSARIAMEAGFGKI